MNVREIKLKGQEALRAENKSELLFEFKRQFDRLVAFTTSEILNLSPSLSRIVL